MSATFVICVGDFPRWEVLVKVGVMEFGLYQALADVLKLLLVKWTYLQSGNDSILVLLNSIVRELGRSQQTHALQR